MRTMRGCRLRGRRLAHQRPLMSAQNNEPAFDALLMTCFQRVSKLETGPFLVAGRCSSFSSVWQSLLALAW
jgi:hypothetical protein